MDIDEASLELRLFHACENANRDEAAELLRCGANLHCANDDGRSPLLLSCQAGHLPLVQLILDASGCMYDVDTEGYNTMLLAAESGNMDLVKWLVQMGQVSLEDRSNDGSTVLLCAAASGNLQLMVWLLDEQLPNLTSISLQDRDERGADCLLAAAEGGAVPLAKELLRRGMSPATIDAYGCGILHYAAAGGHVDMVEFCVRKLHVSCSVRDSDGDTPLMIAAFEDQVHAVKSLLQFKSNVEDTNNAGISMMVSAAAGESAAVLDFMMQKHGQSVWTNEIERNPKLILNFIENGATEAIDAQMDD